ncbi:putative peptidase [Podospora conica]|nr:putative peptidase [Schizothecium conicum]
MRVPLLAALTTNLFVASGCLLDIERQGGHVVDRRSTLHRRQAANGSSIPVSVGDRFSDGNTVPQGVGFHPTANFSTVYNLAEINSAAKALCREFNLPCFDTPHKTFENRTISGLKLGGGPSNASYTVFITAGIHARERGAPDHLLNFASDLLHAHRASTGLVYGGMTYSPADVRAALSVGVVLLPILNPDGLAHDHATDLCWRKNRNPARAVPGDPNSVGVDLNRNFSPFWNFTEYFVPKGPAPASDDPASEQYHGTAPLSEPETRDVDWVMGAHQNLGWFLDVHSYAGVVLHGWFHESNQFGDASMNFRNPEYRGMMGAYPDADGTRYREFLDAKDWDAMSVAAARVAGGMTDSTGKTYLGLPAANYAPSSGSSGDHGMWRALTGEGGRKVRGLGMEFGGSNRGVECSFYPTVERHRMSMVETGAGFMELLLNAARLG